MRHYEDPVEEAEDAMASLASASRAIRSHRCACLARAHGSGCRARIAYSIAERRLREAQLTLHTIENIIEERYL